MKHKFKPDGCDDRDIERDTVADMADAMDRFFECLDAKKRDRVKARDGEDKLAKRLEDDSD